MNAFTRAVRGYLSDARDAFVYAPLEVAMGIIVAITFSVAIRASGNDGQWWGNVMAAAIIALPLVFAASVLRARGVISAAQRWAMSGVVLAAAALYAGFLFDVNREGEVWRAASLAGAAWLALTLVPLPRVADDAGRRRAFWRFNAMLLARMVTVGLYGAAMFAALAGAITAVSTLFELKAPDNLYGDLAGIIFFALVPWLVAGGLPELTAPVPEGHVAPLTAVRRIGRYLYAVVLVIYLAILFAYTVKVIATGDLPKNILSPIVLFAGLAGLLGGMLLEPLQDDGESRGVARLVRTFPALLLPLLPLPVWAVWMRRGQYGWTEFRYLRFAVLATLLVLAVWGTVLLVRRRRPLLIQIPIVLAAMLALASVGPWSAQAVSRRDQSERLRTGLAQAGLIKGGRLTRPLLPALKESANPSTLPSEQYQAISGAMRYLYEAHGPAAVERVLGVPLAGYNGGYQVLTALAIAEGCKQSADRALDAELAEGTPIPTAAGGVLYRVSGYNYGGSTATEGIDQIERRNPRLVGVKLSARGVTLGQAGQWRAHADATPILQLMLAHKTFGCTPNEQKLHLTPAQARLPLVDEAGRTRGELIVTGVAFNNYPRENDKSEVRPMEMQHISGFAILRP